MPTACGTKQPSVVSRSVDSSASQYALARLRASHLAHVQLARLFPGWEARWPQGRVGRRPGTFGRTLCRIDCLLTIGNQALKQASWRPPSRDTRSDSAVDRIGNSLRSVGRPWNIIGFAANFSRFHGPDSAVTIIASTNWVHMLELVFGFLSRLCVKRPLRTYLVVGERVEKQFKGLAEWWRRYAAHTVR